MKGKKQKVNAKDSVVDKKLTKAAKNLFEEDDEEQQEDLKLQENTVLDENEEEKEDGNEGDEEVDDDDHVDEFGGEDDEENESGEDTIPEIDLEDDDEDEDDEDDEDEDEEDDEDDDNLNEDDDSSEEELANLILEEENKGKVSSKGKGKEKSEKKKEKQKVAEESSEPLIVDTDSESSDEEHSKNTVGKIPIEWYDDYPHIGYDLDGNKIMKPATGDELDKFLDKMEDPEKWINTVQDKMTQKDYVLTDKEIEIIERIMGGKFPDSSYNPYEDYIDFFTHEKEIHPISSAPEPKRRFVPSKWEAKKILKLVRAIRKGYIKTKSDLKKQAVFYDIWNKDSKDDSIGRVDQFPAPKLRLPHHNESYNPPKEYLFTEGELKRWMSLDPEDRKPSFIPQKYSNLRSVPAYSNFIQERFERCLDLYLCPRVRKNRLNIDPESLIPKLPKPRDLQPFPVRQVIMYEGHTDQVKSISPDPTGHWVITGSDDKTVRLYEVSTGRCYKVFEFEESVNHVAWNPNKSFSCFSVCHGFNVTVINPGIGSKDDVENTDEMIKSAFSGQRESEGVGVTWLESSESDYKRCHRFSIKHITEVREVIWHRKGDYFASVCPEGKSKSVFIHQLTKAQSQNPFKKTNGLIQHVCFHPLKPHFFVATQRQVKVYNLSQQRLMKVLNAGVKWISSLDVHPKGDNLIIGSYDKRVCWFDMDLSDKPYRVLRFHTKAVRTVSYHSKYPLFASSGDDGTIQIFHGMVYNDLLQNALIVPLKILKGHQIVDEFGVFECKFHPTQPWIFSCGADNTARLYS